MSRARAHRVAPKSGRPEEANCCYCGLRYYARALSAHVCAKAPGLPDAPLDYKGARHLTLAEIQRCRVESGLPESERIKRALAQAERSAA